MDKYGELEVSDYFDIDYSGAGTSFALTVFEN
jgi:hypothetical protein